MNTTHMIQLVNMNTGAVAGHKAGCSDLKKLAARHEVHAPEAHATKYAAWLDYNVDFLNEDPTGDSAWTIDWKNCSNHIPEGAPAAHASAEAIEDAIAEGEATEEDLTGATDNLTRTQCLMALAEVGYTGPTSYLMPQLRAIVAAHI